MTEYQSNLIRMWDSMRIDNKGAMSCISVNCAKCQLVDVCNSNGSSLYHLEEILEIVNKMGKRTSCENRTR